ncbi:hypothetical protein C7974DRAFT_84641 [Boeremia exigua]|uniref:uncharacterized protein n=1 Tax=Boeremia exigua TaxID=749465 RepID=UPI001E8C9FC2|nr:uncharacterized protein C7974DRAFT_84641 [Boeremia exigua]KAH6612741.1 hypothetical protein C7974DRAFT_84641 [Boeremia exigua]
MVPNVGVGTEGPVQRGWGLWLTSVLAVVIAAIFVAARLTQRLIKRSGLGMDDYMIIAALLSSGLLSLTECQAVVYGYGRHWNTLSPDTRMTARKWFYGAHIVYKVVLMFNKISIACLYYRIFAVSSSSFRVACHVMNVWIITSSLAFIVATIFQCTPVSAFWDRSIPFKCFKNEPWWISYASTQISTDFALLLMPLPVIRKLSMGRTEKLGICLVFGTGVFVTFASIYRATTIAASASDPDPTWGPVPATIWSVIEANAGIVCACLPMLRSPFVRLFGPVFGRSRKDTSKADGSIHLTWRSDKPHASAAVSSRRKGADDTIMDPERDSEEGIVTSGHGAPIHNRETRVKVRGRSPSGIFVRKEFSVDDDIAKTQIDGDQSTVGSVSEDRSHGKAPYSHI